MSHAKFEIISFGEGALSILDASFRAKESFRVGGKLLALTGVSHHWTGVEVGKVSAVAQEVAEISNPAWNGEGLPPVGTVCEVQHPDKPDTWCKCTILVWDSECAVFSAAGNYPFAYDGNGYPESFRPIRTPEQLAAEERERGIAEMCELFMRNKADAIRVVDCCERLYDAGCRMPGKEAKV